MEPGFVVDFSHGNRRRVPEWFEGEPRYSFLFGLKPPDRRIKIATYRCTRCGYLMEFANPPTGSF